MSAEPDAGAFRPPRFDVDVAEDAGRPLCCSVSGELDLVTEPQLDRGAGRRPTAARCAIDLSELAFMDSTGPARAARRRAHLPGPAAQRPAAAAGPAPARADADARRSCRSSRRLVGVDVLDRRRRRGRRRPGSRPPRGTRRRSPASSPSSVMIRSSDCARAHGQQRRALELRRVQQPDLRLRRARGRVQRVRQRAARRRQAVLERDARRPR